MAKETKIGAQILVDELLDLGTEYVFGYPGGANLPIYNVINKTKMEVVLNGDERCAGHAAEGYARATGRPGVCLVTSGPGATNLITPLADAKMDSTPIIGISGQVYSHLIGKDAFQETPITALTMQVTKHNYLVTRPIDIARVIREAFHIATTGRPGPVLVDITKDAQENAFPVEDINREFNLPGYNVSKAADDIDLKKVEAISAMIKEAKKPLIYMGQGIVLGDASEELLEFAEKTQIPVTTTILGLGGFPGSHPLYAGMLGMHGTAHANLAIDQADLVICLGARFDDRVTGKVSEFIKNARIIHVDVDESELNKNKYADVALRGDIKTVLTLLNAKVEKTDAQQWRDHVDTLKRDYPLQAPRSEDGHIKPQYFLRQLSNAMKGKDAIYCTGVGQHQMWACQHITYETPRSLITSAGLGTMGFGLPASVGAALGRPKATVFNIDGDGSFEMNINELRTIADRNIPVKLIILNNKILGMVGQWQRRFYDKNYSSVEFKEFPKYAEGVKALYGIESRCIEKQDDIADAIRQMIEFDGPFLLEVKIPKEEDVLPMIPGGQTVKQMILEPGTGAGTGSK